MTAVELEWAYEMAPQMTGATGRGRPPVKPGPL
jgi:hypothetical protein